jgi:hypothetical protein
MLTKVILWVHINAVKIEFDPEKDEINRAKRGISLEAATGFDWDTAF